jgi:hypothetical protein
VATQSGVDRPEQEVEGVGQQKKVCKRGGREVSNNIGLSKCLKCASEEVDNVQGGRDLSGAVEQGLQPKGGGGSALVLRGS